MKGYSHLTQVHRCIIEWGVRKGKTQTELAELCGVHKSTISRELKRNTSTKSGIYNALGAESNALSRKTGWADYVRKIEGSLEEAIIQKLSQRWSPEQISGRLKEEGKQGVCPETIYRWVYRAVVRQDLKQVLRRFRSRQRRGRRRQNRYLSIERRKYIHQRPQFIEKRQHIGHWERDLLLGQQSGQSLLTMVERKSRYTLLGKVGSRRCDQVNDLTARIINENQNLKFITMTNDNGGEFGQPAKLEAKAGLLVYFNEPHSPWQRGSIENLNGLLRQYFPKRINMNQVTDQEIKFAQDALNHRPRKSLGYKTPHEVMFGIKEKLFKSRKEYKQDWKKRELESYLDFLKMCCT